MSGRLISWTNNCPRRAKGEDCVLGGKGINVSGVLAQLGCESVALGFVAGETGAWLERGLAAQGLKTDLCIWNRA